MQNEYKKKSKYDCELSPEIIKSNPFSAISLITDSVRENSFVLDIGCSTGFFGAYLKTHKNCRVWGMDNNAYAIKEATKVLDKAFVFDIEKIEGIDSLPFKQEKFDVIVLAAVLEHVRNPNQILQTCKKLLSPSGYIILSLPNIANYKTRLGLLMGKFNYEDYGILDKTHVHLYTIATARELLRDSNLELLNSKVSIPLPGVSILIKMKLNLIIRSLETIAPSFFGEEIILTTR